MIKWSETEGRFQVKHPPAIAVPNRIVSRVLQQPGATDVMALDFECPPFGDVTPQRERGVFLIEQGIIRLMGVAIVFRVVAARLEPFVETIRRAAIPG
jgi:hypothetical protein